MVEPEGAGAEERLQWFLERNPLTRELIQDATRVEGDLLSYAHLPYLVDRVAGRGWTLVGDAAGFLDPFYSPGIDQLAFSVSWTMELLGRRLGGADPSEFDEELREHNRSYLKYMRGFFDAIYRDKYALMGDYDAMTASFLMDTALYYIYVIWPIYKKGSRGLLYPPFYRKYSEYGAVVIGWYQRRLVSIARRKLKLGIYGNRNAGKRPRILGFTLGLTTVWLLLQGMARWLRAEAENAWTYISRPKPLRAGLPEPYAPPVEGTEMTPSRVPAP